MTDAKQELQTAIYRSAFAPIGVKQARLAKLRALRSADLARELSEKSDSIHSAVMA